MSFAASKLGAVECGSKWSDACHLGLTRPKRSESAVSLGCISMEEGAKFQKGGRCGRYFLPKVDYHGQYCDRAASDENCTCQQLAVQKKDSCLTGELSPNEFDRLAGRE